MGLLSGAASMRLPWSRRGYGTDVLTIAWNLAMSRKTEAGCQGRNFQYQLHFTARASPCNGRSAPVRCSGMPECALERA